MSGFGIAVLFCLLFIFVEMKWRVLVLLIAGIAMIYFVSLLQDIPYPHPLVIQSFEPKQLRENEPRQVVLSETNDYIYRTHIHYEAAMDSSRGFIHGVDSIKLNVFGLVIQARKKKSEFLKQVPEEDWEVCFKHLLRGPISQVSKAPGDTGAIQFATLYHQVEDDIIKHYVRIYYLVNDSFEYKDVLLPGNTMVTALSLEQESIIYSRDPDYFRFRVATLPHNLTNAPHSDKSAIIPILRKDEQTGDPIKLYHQPGNTESHALLLSGLYSPNADTLRVFTLDIHKTKYYFHTNVSIVDGHKHGGKDWILRDHLNTRDSTISEDSLEYMSYVDGAHFHQERTFINMPIPSISRSKDAKTVVISLVRNDFQTLDYTDNLGALKSNRNDRKYLYKNTEGDILDEFYHTMQIPDSVESASEYDDIRGVQLNSDGTLLAVWTETNSIYIYKRGSGDQQQQQQRWLSGEKGPESPHYLEKPLEWILRMVITPKEGQIGLIAPVGAVIFWEKDNHHYISVGMKSYVVNTYSIDVAKEQAEVNFLSFMREKWDLWLVMSMIVTIFVVNEYKSYPV